MILELKSVRSGYDGIEVLHGVNLAVEKGTIVAVIGANGAGKSTTLKTISGLLKPSGGEIIYEGRKIGGLSAPAIVRLGIGHIPEGRQIFASQTVLDNLILGSYVHLRRISRQDWLQQLEEVLALFPDLKPRLHNDAGALSGGQQQMLAIARGLMTRPRLLMMDEPSLGLGPQVLEVIFSVIQDLKKRGISILLVEQNARLSLAIADYGYVMEGGVVALHGTGRELLHNDEVVHRYLGIGSDLRGQEDEKSRRELTERLRMVLERF